MENVRGKNHSNKRRIDPKRYNSASEQVPRKYRVITVDKI